MNAELEKLVALQKSDTRIRQLKTAIETAPKRRAAAEQEFEARAFSIRAIQTQRDDANAVRSKLENDIAASGTSLERAERNLKASQNQKEYEAAMREKDVLQKQISDLETKMLEAGESLEEAEKVLSERAEEIASIEGERAAMLKEFEAETENLKIELEAEQKHRAEHFAQLLPKDAAVYNRLVTRIRDGVAVAEVKNGACGSCFMSLRPQVQADVKKGDRIITCESCNRILYAVPKETTQTV